MGRRMKRRKIPQEKRPAVEARQVLDALTNLDIAAAKIVEAQAQIGRSIERLVASTDLDLSEIPLVKERFAFDIGYVEEEPRAFQLVLPEFPPRLEVHWQVLPTRENYKAVRDRWFSLVRTAIHTAKAAGVPLPGEPLSRALVVIKTCFGSALSRDPDNYTAKFIIDALRRENILKEDDIEQVQIVLRGSKEKPPRTEILVAEIWDEHEALISGVTSRIRRVPFEWDGGLHRYKPIFTGGQNPEDQARLGDQESPDLEEDPPNLP